MLMLAPSISCLPAYNRGNSSRAATGAKIRLTPEAFGLRGLEILRYDGFPNIRGRRNPKTRLEL